MASLKLKRLLRKREALKKSEPVEKHVRTFTLKNRKFVILKTKHS